MDFFQHAESCTADARSTALERSDESSIQTVSILEIPVLKVSFILLGFGETVLFSLNKVKKEKIRNTATREITLLSGGEKRQHCGRELAFKNLSPVELEAVCFVRCQIEELTGFLLLQTVKPELSFTSKTGLILQFVIFLTSVTEQWSGLILE